MKQTPNINLPILEQGDKYLKETQNEAFSVIDREIAGLNSAISVLDNVEGSIVDTKSDVEALKNETNTLKASLNDMESNVIPTIQSSLDNMKISFNKNRKIKSKFGVAPWFADSDSNEWVEETVNRIKYTCVDEMQMVVHINYKDGEFFTHQNMEQMYYCYQKLKENDIDMNMIKFHTYFDEPSILKGDVLEKWKVYWKVELEKWANKFSGLGIEYFTVLNEIPMIYNKVEHDNFVVECLNIVKSYGFKAGVSTSGIIQSLELSETLHQNVDGYFVNLYPQISYNGKNTSLEESTKSWYNMVLLSRELKKKGKPMLMTETGTDDRWCALAQSELSGWEKHEPHTTGGYASRLYLYGLFNSGVCEFYDHITYYYLAPLVNEPCRNIIKEYLGVI